MRRLFYLVLVAVLAGAASGADFLAENAKKPGVEVRDSGLQYRVIEEGAGTPPGPYDMVTVHYRGSFADGEEFDSSYSRGRPSTFNVSGLIPAWTEALQLMKPGAKWELVVPPALGYGERGTEGIPPNSVLVFEIELVSVEQAPPANPRIASIISQPVTPHDCGDAPSVPPSGVSDARRQALHEQGNSWQDCVANYLRDTIIFFTEKADTMRQVDPATVPEFQKYQVNDYFAQAVSAVDSAQAEYDAFWGISAE